MKGKLYKSLNSDTYWLTVDGKLFADTEGGPLMAITDKLSVKNCIDIKNGYDLMKLAEENSHKYYDVKTTDWHCNYNGFFSGFQKAMELNKDKMFTEDDLRKAINWAWRKTDRGEHILIIDEHNFIQSIQQPTEIEVEIETETKVWEFISNGEFESFEIIPKLDSNGCLILKKI